MEGIEHNPVVYELMSEMTFREEKVHVLVSSRIVITRPRGSLPDLEHDCSL